MRPGYWFCGVALSVEAISGLHCNFLSFAILSPHKFRILRAFSWFVKVPKSPATSSLDATETFMYNVMFPALQTFADQHYRGANSGDVMKMPITAVYHAHYSAKRPEGNHLVMQDLGDINFQQIKPGNGSSKIDVNHGGI